MKLTGRIDRTDVYEDDGHVYVKVMDYKTGRKTFDVGEVYQCLPLQLPVLYECGAGDGAAHPCGKRDRSGGHALLSDQGSDH